MLTEYIAMTVLAFCALPFFDIFLLIKLEHLVNTACVHTIYILIYWEL